MLIAEIGQNHNGEIALAKELIHAAKESGADVAKFQLFDARKLFPKEGNQWFDYNCSTELSFNSTLELSDLCKKIGIEFMASAFDIERVGWLEEIGVSKYKLASRSIADSTLINSIISTKKKIIVSLGYWNKPELPNFFPKDRTEFLFCVSKYPTEYTDLNFSEIDFKMYAGFSDHTVGTTAPLVAMSRGARIIEKHFTLDKNLYGPDHKGSMTPVELKMLSEYWKDIKECL